MDGFGAGWARLPLTLRSAIPRLIAPDADLGVRFLNDPTLWVDSFGDLFPTTGKEALSLTTSELLYRYETDPAHPLYRIARWRVRP